MLLEDLLNNVMEVISSREASESATPTSELEPEVCEADYATRAKMILDTTFSRVRQRLKAQQAHLPPPVEEVPELICQRLSKGHLRNQIKVGKIYACLAVIMTAKMK